MKSLFLTGILILILAGCDERMPNDLKAQIAAESFLDTLYRPNKVVDKTGIGFIKITDYLDPSKKNYLNQSKRGTFQSIIKYYYPSGDEWVAFTEKASKILSKGEEHVKGAIQLERYKVKDTKYITAFFVDSTFSRVFGRIQL